MRIADTLLIELCFVQQRSPQRLQRLNSLWLKSRKLMRRGFEPDSRRRNEAVLIEIRASFDNEEAGSDTQAAVARLSPQVVKPGGDRTQ
jgi:hypothetical protein